MSSSAARYFPRAFGSFSLSEANTEEPSQQLSDERSDLLVGDTTISDEALVGRLCSGDIEVALGLLLRRYARIVRSIAYRILRDQAEADDLTQEIFLLIHQKAATFDGSKASARVWILQMTYHRAFNRRRYLTRRHFYGQVDLENVGPQLMDSRNDAERIHQFLDSATRNTALQKLMAALSDNQQKTLRLYFFEGYTLDEIASELGQSKENVRHHYFRGLNKLRKQIFHDHNGR